MNGIGPRERAMQLAGAARRLKTGVEFVSGHLTDEEDDQ